MTIKSNLIATSAFFSKPDAENGADAPSLPKKAKQKYVVSETLDNGTDTPDWTEGDTIRKPEDIVGYYAAFYNSIYKPPLLDTLTPVEVFLIVEEIPSTADATDDDKRRLAVLVKGVKEKNKLNAPSSVTSTGNAIKTAAITFGLSLPDEFDSIEAKLADADDTVAEGIVKIAFVIDAKLPRTANNMLCCPFPNVPERTTHKDGTVEYHERPDRFTIGSGANRETTSFYKEAFKARPEAKRYAEVVKQIMRATSNEVEAHASITHPTGEVTTVQMFKDMTAKSRSAAKARWEKKIVRGGQRIAKAAELIMAVESISASKRIRVMLASQPKEGAPELKLNGTKVCDADFVPTPGASKPLYLHDTKITGSATDPISIAAFCNYDFDIIKTNENVSVADLQATASRAGGAGGTTQVASIKDADFDKSDEYLAALAHWYGERVNFTHMYQQAHAGKLDIGTVVSIHTLGNALDSMRTATQKQFDKYETDRLAEQEQAKTNNNKTGTEG